MGSLLLNWIGPQPGDPKPILYFSGNFPYAREEEEVLDRSGMKFRCLTYAYLGDTEISWGSSRQRASLNYCFQRGIRIFLDSGAYTAQQHLKQGRISREEIRRLIHSYAKFILRCLEEGYRFDFAATFDHVKQAIEVHRVTKLLRKEYGLQLTPVYHGDSSLDWFHRYVDEGHRLICVGRVKALGSRGLRAYYERLFEEADRLGGVQLHGLMVTGNNLFRFPWHSVDSATWAKLAANGRLLLADQGRKKIAHFRVSRACLTKEQTDAIAALGFDLKTLQTSPSERCVYNILEFLKLGTDRTYLQSRPRWQLMSF